MYGRTLDDFEYRGVKFRWVRSPNWLIYRVYRESDLIGTIPVSRVRLRHSPEAIKALYPICDAWLEQQEESPLITLKESTEAALRAERALVEELKQEAERTAVVDEIPFVGVGEPTVAKSTKQRKAPKAKRRTKKI